MHTYFQSPLVVLEDDLDEETLLSLTEDEWFPWAINDSIRANARQLGLLLHNQGLSVEVVESWDEDSTWMEVRVMQPSMCIIVAEHAGLITVDEYLTDSREIVDIVQRSCVALETATGLSPLPSRLSTFSGQYS